MDQKAPDLIAKVNNLLPLIEKGEVTESTEPGGKISFEGMKLAGVSIVLTLLHENEGAGPIGDALQKQKIEWIWFPFSASRPPEGTKVREVTNLFKSIKDVLQAGMKIYIHCSAGIHRTGMVTYAFLRYLGQDKKTALENLEKLRNITAEGATEERLLWADQFY